jgi:hypothetical protein
VLQGAGIEGAVAGPRGGLAALDGGAVHGLRFPGTNWPNAAAWLGGARGQTDLTICFEHQYGHVGTLGSASEAPQPMPRIGRVFIFRSRAAAPRAKAQNFLGGGSVGTAVCVRGCSLTGRARLVRRITPLTLYGQGQDSVRSSDGFDGMYGEGGSDGLGY